MSTQQYRPQRFTILPPVVKNLLIINGLMYLATTVFQSQYHIDLSEYLGLHYFSSSYFKPYQLITYMFMHGSLEHVFFNMFALWMFGNTLENFWGSKRFLVYYMITGIGAALIYLGYEAYQIHEMQQALQSLVMNTTSEQYVNVLSNHFNAFYELPEIRSQVEEFVRQWNAHPLDLGMQSHAIADIQQLITFKEDVPMIGASGSVFGVLLAFGMLFPNVMLYVYFFFPIRAKYFVILYGLMELGLGIANNPTDNVAHFAHLGGMLFGFFLIRYWQKHKTRF